MLLASPAPLSQAGTTVAATCPHLTSPVWAQETLCPSLSTSGLTWSIAGTRSKAGKEEVMGQGRREEI